MIIDNTGWQWLITWIVVSIGGESWADHEAGDTQSHPKSLNLQRKIWPKVFFWWVLYWETEFCCDMFRWHRKTWKQAMSDLSMLSWRDLAQLRQLSDMRNLLDHSTLEEAGFGWWNALNDEEMSTLGHEYVTFGRGLDQFGIRSVRHFSLHLSKYLA